MKHLLLPALLATAFLLGSCQFFRPTVRQQHWFLNSTDFRASNASMRMQISGAEMDGNRIRLFVHVTDTNHFYYRNIPVGAFCNPVVRYDGQDYPIRNFRATEYRNVNREPQAYALVLDHSGSMRLNKGRLYQATRGLIETKREPDAYSIVRYADMAIVDAPLHTDKQALLTPFAPEPRHYIGGLTATWDGMVEGINTLEGSPYGTRTVVVFTDGGENASKVTKDWAFWRAKMAGVRIVAISLGTGGSQNMKDLCESTGGMYVPINDIDEIPAAYTDLKNKTGSFYLVEFETPFIGKQTVQLNLCENIGLQDTYAFDNRPPGPEPQRLKDQLPVIQTPDVDLPKPKPDTDEPRPTTTNTPRPTGTQTTGTPRPTTTTPRPTTGTGTVTGKPTFTPPARSNTPVTGGGRTGGTASAPRP